MSCLTKNVREAIRRKGLKENWVAEQMPMSQTAFSNRMTGKVKLTAAELGRIAKIAGFSDDEIKKIFRNL